MRKRNVNLSSEQQEQIAFFLDELDALGVDPLHFLVATVRAENAVRRGRPWGVVSTSRALVRTIARMLTGDPESEESPWQSPSVQTALFSWRFDLPALGELLRDVANAIDPPVKRLGRPISHLEAHRRGVDTLHLRGARMRLSAARSGSPWSNDPRVREALALGLNANETAAVLAFAERRKRTGRLEEIDVDEAVRYFDAARKWKKPGVSVPQRSAVGLARYAHKAGREAPPERKETTADAEAQPQRRTPANAAEVRSRPRPSSPRRGKGPRLDRGVPPAARGRRDGAPAYQDGKGRHLPAQPPRGVGPAKHDRPERHRPAARREPAGGLKGKKPP